MTDQTEDKQAAHELTIPEQMRMVLTICIEQACKTVKVEGELPENTAFADELFSLMRESGILRHSTIYGDKGLHIASGVASDTLQPYIQLLDKANDNYFQINAFEARDTTREMFEACEAAMTDSFMFRFVHEHLGLEPEQAAPIIEMMRGFREDGTMEFPEGYTFGEDEEGSEPESESDQSDADADS